MFCDTCRAIPFKQMHDGAEMDIAKWAIGTLPELRNRQHCSLCSFVLKVIYDKRVRVYPTLSWYEKNAVTLHWDDVGGDFFVDSTGPGCSIRFMEGDWKHGTGRELTNNYIEIDLIKGWLRRCLSDHVHTCPPAPLGDTGPAQDCFRCIDVQRLCIVQTSVLSSYVTLSYVWGQTQNLRLIKDNQTRLMNDQGLSELWDKVPLTIRDAIWLVQQMGITYLWVDSLCLVQDDKDDTAAGVQMMDLIYEQSLFTIVAASGTDANSGLAGIRSKPRTASQVTCEVAPGMRLLLAHEIEASVKQTTYSTRAWTFQEFLLSRRRVVFLNDMVYFHCRTGSWEEEVHGRYTRENRASLLSIMQFDSPDFDSCEIFQNLLFYYTTRKATFETDYLAAMTGLCHRVGQRTKCKFLCGIPVAAFDIHLLFAAGSDTPLERRREFPSWSWAGWSGHLRYYVEALNKNDWLTSNTWIVWHKRNPSGVVSLVWDPAAHEAQGDVSYTRRQGFPRGLGLDNISTSRVTPSWDLAPGTTLPSYPVLQFWTMTVYYKLRRGKIREPIWNNYEIYDSSGSACGHLTGESISPHTINDEPVEFILLSNDGPKDELETREVDGSGDRYWAMWIERKAGIAERKELARIYCNKLVKSFRPGPSWKEILLA